MTDWPLFIKKTVAVFALSLLVVPLVGMKGGFPATAYLVGLVALHVFVLGIYFYRIRFRELDHDYRSLIARVAALVFVGYLLLVVSDFDESTSRNTLAMQMIGVSVLHTAVLLLLMVRISRPDTGGPRKPPAGIAEEPAEG
ncbi:MAG: hypothetical protein AB7I38_02810 [Dehalococcoidia bacterium]